VAREYQETQTRVVVVDLEEVQVRLQQVAQVVLA
jgi:hypothetical protein